MNETDMARIEAQSINPLCDCAMCQDLGLVIAALRASWAERDALAVREAEFGALREQEAREADSQRYRAEAAEASLAAAHGLQARADLLVDVLEIIAGERQCIDNLMSHAEIARAALLRTRGFVSGSPARQTAAATPEPQTVAQGGEQAAVAAAHGLLARAERAEAALALAEGALEAIAEETKTYKGYGNFDIEPAMSAEDAQSRARHALEQIARIKTDAALAAVPS